MDRPKDCHFKWHDGNRSGWFWNGPRRASYASAEQDAAVERGEGGGGDLPCLMVVDAAVSPARHRPIPPMTGP